MANAALFYGLVTVIGTSERPLWSQMSFRAAEENFHQAARTGMETELYWPSVGTVPVPELVLRHLLPLAHSGLEQMGVDVEVRDRLLGIIEQRCITGRNGATWLIDDFEHRLEASSGDRPAAMQGHDAALPGADAPQRAGARLAHWRNGRLKPDRGSCRDVWSGMAHWTQRLTTGLIVAPFYRSVRLIVPVNPATGSPLRAITRRLPGGKNADDKKATNCRRRPP